MPLQGYSNLNWGTNSIGLSQLVQESKFEGSEQEPEEMSKEIP